MMLKNYKKLGKQPWFPWALGAVAFLFLILLPTFAGRYTIFIFYILFLRIGLAQSWNLVAGYTGLISLGHAAFFGLGAYTSGMLITYSDFSFTAAVIAGGLVAALFSAVISVPTFRFRGIYFAIGTLILAEALRIWMINWEVTGGAQGLHFPVGSGLSLNGFYYLMLAIASGMTLLIVVILRVKLGIGLRAIRDNEDGAQNMGVNTFRTKLYAFLISAFAAGMMGSVHAAKLGAIEPYSIFGMAWTTTLINIVIIGGIGTVIGPIVGAIFITILAENLANFYTYHLIITGIILILMIRFMPAGIWGTLRNSRLFTRVTKIGEANAPPRPMGEV